MLIHPVSIPNRQELVINWHVTEACNFGCRYCYSHWEKPASKRELVHDAIRSARLIEELSAFFSPSNRANPLANEFKWTSVRLNLAGGEPLLYERRIVEIAQQARSHGLDLSVITNASRLNNALMTELAGLLSLFGISVDSSDAARNQLIGRVSRTGQALQLPNLTEMIAHGRALNPTLRLKINTVVNSLNWDENMTELIKQLAPDRWKVLRMLPSTTSDLAVTAEQFKAFVTRHANQGLPMCAEDNADMVQSYIMIDPHGRFYQNGTGKSGYSYSMPIPDVGAANAFAQYEFSVSRYLARYTAV